MFYFLSNCKAMESALMQDEKLCRNNMVISPQARYVNRICKKQTLELKDCTTINNAINFWLHNNSWTYIHKNMTYLGKNHYTPNASTKSIYYYKITANLITYYNPKFIRNHLLNLCWEWEILWCEYQDLTVWYLSQNHWPIFHE